MDPAKDSAFRNMIDGFYADYEIVSSQGEVPNTYTLKMRARAADEYRLQAVDQALRTIENRVNALGVAEPVIQKRGGPGEHEIIVQFPGIDDPEVCEADYRQAGVARTQARAGNLVVSNPGSCFAAVWRNTSSELGSPGVFQRRRTVAARSIWIVNKVAGVTGRELKSAGVSRDENGRPAVSFNLNATGAQKFGRLTEENIGRLLAIVLDGQVESAPRLNSRITDNGIITGGGAGFAPEEARELALVLKSGALAGSHDDAAGVGRRSQPGGGFD